ncbi:MAG: hypothetical protein ACRD9R_10005 [Pyrinomonadaceae bacterium]
MLIGAGVINHDHIRPDLLPKDYGRISAVRQFINFLRSLSSPVFWLVISGLGIAAVLLILLAFQLIKPSILRNLW